MIHSRRGAVHAAFSVVLMLGLSVAHAESGTSTGGTPEVPVTGGEYVGQFIGNFSLSVPGTLKNGVMLGTTFLRGGISATYGSVGQPGDPGVPGAHTPTDHIFGVQRTGGPGHSLPRERLDEAMARARTNHERLVAQDRYLAETQPDRRMPLGLGPVRGMGIDSPVGAPSYIDAKLASQFVTPGGHQNEPGTPGQPAAAPLEMKTLPFVDPSQTRSGERGGREAEEEALRAVAAQLGGAGDGANRQAIEKLLARLNEGVTRGDELITAEDIRALPEDARQVVQQIVNNRVFEPSGTGSERRISVAASATARSETGQPTSNTPTAPVVTAGDGRIVALNNILSQSANVTLPVKKTESPPDDKKKMEKSGALVAVAIAASGIGGGQPGAVVSSPERDGEGGQLNGRPLGIFDRAKLAVTRVLQAVQRRLLGASGTAGALARAEENGELHPGSGMAPGDKILLPNGTLTKVTRSLAGLSPALGDEPVGWTWLIVIVALVLSWLGWRARWGRYLTARRAMAPAALRVQTPAPFPSAPESFVPSKEAAPSAKKPREKSSERTSTTNVFTVRRKAETGKLERRTKR